MTKQVFALFFFTLNVSFAFSQKEISFSTTIEVIKKSNKSNNNRHIEQLIVMHKNLPIINQDTVTFITKKRSGSCPVLLADFNGFMNSRYVKEASLGEMYPIPTTDWCFYSKKLHLSSLIHYQFKSGQGKYNDPLNSKIKINFGYPVSFVQMKEYKTFELGVSDFSVLKGKMIKLDFDSKIFKSKRKVHVYLPPNYNTHENYPTVYFHDGSFFVNEANIQIILDNLIGQQKIRPLIAIFDNPVIRGKEYRNGVDFRNYLKDELIPYVDKTYSLKSTNRNRAIIGSSRGGLSAIYLAHSLNEFSFCGALSPAIHPKNVSDFTKELEGMPFKPKKVFLTRSVYDKIWQQDAIDLKKHFENSLIETEYAEINEGHNINAWRTFIDDMIISFFPPN